MRDYLMFALAAVLIVMTLKDAMTGMLAFTWFSLMNPHRLTYGLAYDFPFAAIFAVATLLSLAKSRQQKQFPVTAVTITLLFFLIWTTFTSWFALEPQLVWIEWQRVVKTLFMTCVALLIVRSKKDIISLAWVVGLSLAFYGIKGGIFTIISGGNFHVIGPEGSYIEDNNALALALVVALPIIRYVQMRITHQWFRYALIGALILTAVSAAGSYSRGALLAGGAIFCFLWIKSRRKLATGVALIAICGVVSLVMPQAWFDRMNTIDNYQKDNSSLGRINAWKFAINVAESNPLGGGFSTFTKPLFLVYAPEPLNYHAAHSIYFQVLGEHGFVGLALYMALLFFSWRTGSRIIKFCKDKEEYQWASDLAAMCQVSLVGYAIGGAFLTLAYYDLYYFIIVLLVGMEKILLAQTKRKSLSTSLFLARLDNPENISVR